MAEIARKIKRYFINDTKSFGFSSLEPYFLRWVTGALSYGDTSGPANECPKRKPVIGVEHYISLAHKINGQTDISGGTYTALTTYVAAELSGYAGKFSCRLRRKEFQQFVPILGGSERALKLTRSVCLRAF